MPLHFTERPLASQGLKSFRYKGRWGWVMIGAHDVPDALNEAKRSIGSPADPALLQRWDGNAYQPVPAARAFQPAAEDIK